MISVDGVRLTRGAASVPALGASGLQRFAKIEISNAWDGCVRNHPAAATSRLRHIGLWDEGRGRDEACKVRLGRRLPKAAMKIEMRLPPGIISTAVLTPA